MVVGVVTMRKEQRSSMASSATDGTARSLSVAHPGSDRDSPS